MIQGSFLPEKTTAKGCADLENSDMIIVQNCSKSFGKQKVLSNISFTLKKGGIYGIVGRNGSGKTVLFKCMMGFFKLDSGKITVFGKEIGKDMDLLTDCGMVIEEPAFLPGKSGIKNLEYLYELNHHRDKKYMKQIMKKVGLEHAVQKHVGKYSMGMKQRLAIAQAIMENQELLILDEPMNGLDRQGVEDMLILFRQLKKEGKTILMASHNKEDIDLLCDQVYLMDGGSLTIIQPTAAHRF